MWLAEPVQAQTVSGAYDYIESAFELEVVRLESASQGGAGALVTCEFTVEEVR
jgi:hypothetical protein